MAHGVRAKTLAFVGFDQALTLIGQLGWPWLGSGGTTSSARRISLNGGPPRGFILRLLSVKVGRTVATCRVQLESGGQDLLVGELTFVPAAGETAGTRVALNANAARALTGTDVDRTSTEMRDIANASARSVVEAIAALESAASDERRRMRKQVQR